ncbi:hypothetical protein [Methylobacter tundripaludum]|uniref:hypothetical protein n=1 Tax=Methylobacter tundripaludum TaxID=173365 RepID=UPI000484679D|nr:hypothetical protein [Methylobacter tundripaludum]
MAQALASRIADMLRQSANKLGTVDPVPSLGGLLNRTFVLPQGDPRYADNALTPGAAPFEPSSDLQSGQLRFNIQPLGPDASGIDRRDESTREMRRLVNTFFGREALRWFDERSEPWRGFGSGSNLNFGAFFGTGYDRNGLYNSKVYYESGPGQIESLPMSLFGLVSTAMSVMPKLRPLFTTISAQRDLGSERLTFAHPQALRIADLQPLLDALGLGYRMPGILQILGLVLGGRFDLPANATLIGVGQGQDGPEIEIYVLLGMIPDLPPNFLGLLTLGLSERPRELTALESWMSAFTPEDDVWPGRFSIISVRTSPAISARVSLYLRPVEFEVPSQAYRSANGQS